MYAQNMVIFLRRKLLKEKEVIINLGYLKAAHRLLGRGLALSDQA